VNVEILIYFGVSKILPNFILIKYSSFFQDMMASSDKSSFKGFRKQFSGRFKRLVTRKVEHTPVIPPELKPQLKTIYVY